MIKGTVAQNIIDVLEKTPERLRKQVREVTMDMAANNAASYKKMFYECASRH